ncbi:hypothetical protein K432DRAFT_385131 [Lepidopterella palustris CBS 459.81]|uniref:Uncharacterized protein n=1 Tax=Lepidopterella palustris CBS 459.81 TaxID=1314670 RepID=A0A8E2E3R8_9PEZI|nr:hypothetical protein K432DRAFT_385131 [Lepidopterella palustris CBS 459.81]
MRALYSKVSLRLNQPQCNFYADIISDISKRTAFPGGIAAYCRTLEHGRSRFHDIIIAAIVRSLSPFIRIRVTEHARCASTCCCAVSPWHRRRRLTSPLLLSLSSAQPSNTRLGR